MELPIFLFPRHGRHACYTCSDCRYLQLQQSGIFPTAGQEVRPLSLQFILFESAYDYLWSATERGSARRHEDVSSYLAMFLLKIAGSVVFKLGGLRHVRWIAIFYCCSGFCTLSTTGTDVQGIIPTSVITMETKWGGVTSYTRFSKWRELTSRQSDRTSGLSLVSGTKSSGSPGEKIRF